MSVLYVGTLLVFSNMALGLINVILKYSWENVEESFTEKSCWMMERFDWLGSCAVQRFSNASLNGRWWLSEHLLYPLRRLNTKRIWLHSCRNIDKKEKYVRNLKSIMFSYCGSNLNKNWNNTNRVDQTDNSHINDDKLCVLCQAMDDCK